MGMGDHCHVAFHVFRTNYFSQLPFCPCQPTLVNPQTHKTEPPPWLQVKAQLTSIGLNRSLIFCACPQPQLVTGQHTVMSSEPNSILDWLAHGLATSTRVVIGLWASAYKNWLKIRGRYTSTIFQLGEPARQYAVLLPIIITRSSRVKTTGATPSSCGRRLALNHKAFY